MSEAASEPAEQSFRFEWAVLPSTGETVPVIYEFGHGIHAVSTNWVRDMLALGKSPKTVRTYGLRIAGFLSWCAATGKDWRKPDLNLLSAWKNALLTTPFPSGKELKLRQPDTVDKWLTSTTEFYRWCGGNGHVERALVDVLYESKYIPAGIHSEQGRTVVTRSRELRVPSEPRSAPKWLASPEEREALLALPLSARDRFMVDLLYATGLRGGEALTLFREDLHFLGSNVELGCFIKGAHVHVKDNNSGSDARAKTAPGQGVAKRFVPVPAYVVHSYEAYRAVRIDRLGVDDDPHVFVNLRQGNAGKPFTQDSLDELFERIEKKLGFYVRPHMLRHTRATMWLRGIDGPKLDFDVVQELLGHRSAQSTSIYSHRTDEDLMAAVEGASLMNFLEDADYEGDES